MKNLFIEYANPLDLTDTCTVQFRLIDHEVTRLWVQAVLDAQKLFQIDDPTRFYGFSSREDEIRVAIEKINACVDVINSHSHIVERKLQDINDQDTLNYLHHIFEVYHGLLGEQHHRFYLTAKPNVRKALSDLNILVHRCESAVRGNPPRHIVTYFGLPKDRFFQEDHYKLFTNEHEFGTVMLNYVEIGKTIAELAIDNDQYIEPGAFKPYVHYSADFIVKYWGTDPLQIKERNAIIQQYYESRSDFFGPWKPCYTDGSIPVAIIAQELDLKELVARQYVKSVKFN
jgi:hypothetical protein